MKKIGQVFKLTLLAVFLLLNLLLLAPNTMAQVSLVSGTYTQDFNTLVNTGTSTTLPTGWLLLETLANGNTTYTAGTGSGNAGDTYSFGPASNTDRAFGGLQSGTLLPTIGASFQNNSGSVINSLTINYTGEQWRLGATGRNDQLTFEYSTNASSLNTGTWVAVSGLNFTAPNSTGTVGAFDGNLSANRVTLNATITGLTLANGSSVFIRWNDVNITGADDGLGVDDFSLSFTNAPVVPVISNVSPTSACDGSGAVVIITGANLSGITGVSFNGTPATFTVNTATQITTSLPVGATTGFITITDGTNSANSPSVFTVNPLPDAPIVTGGGTFCGSALITASGGAGGTIYFQQQVSGGTSTYSSSTTWAVLFSGTYYFRSLSAAGCWGPEGSTTVTINSAATPVTIFTESIGTVGGTTIIASHESANGFDNDGYTMSGTGDIRVTTPSSGYAGASGNANVFLTNTGATTFQISGINTTAFQTLSIGFGIFKSTIASNGSELIVEVSSDGINYTPLTFAALPTGSGTATWHYRTATGSVPTTSDLRIRFRNSSTTPMFRIDDISLTGTNPSATITAGGPTTFCPGGNVTLTAPNASSFLWSNGQTTQSIVVNSAGAYSCQLTLPNTCVLTSNTINVTVLSAPVFTSCPSTINDFALSTSCNKLVNYIATASGDPSPSYSYSFTGATIGSGPGTGSGSTFNTGTTTVTITATNSCGSAVCTFSVIITDNTPPIAVCQNITVNLDATGNASITTAQINNGSSDNCSIASMTLSQTAFNCATISGNSLPTDLFISEYIEGSSNNKCIEIFNGTGAPVNLTTGGYQLRYYFNGSTSAGLTIPLTGIVASGDVYVACNSSAAPIFLTQADITNGSGWYNGDDAVVLVKNSGVTVLDIFGRIGEDPGAAWGVSPLITVDKTLRRNSNIISGVAANPGAGFPSLTTEWASFVIDDASGLGSHSLTGGSGSTVVPVTLTVTDVNGLSSNCIANVTVVDNTPPVVICNSGITLSLNSSGTVTLTSAQLDGGSTDACGIANLSVSPSSFNCSNIGSNSVSLTVTDVNGNSNSCVTSVNVVDIIPPVVNCQNVTVVLDANGNGAVTAAQVNNGSTDNCGVASISISGNLFNCSDVGSGVIPTDLIISEYAEGSSNNKCIELYNGTGSPIDMGANGYQLHIYFNGGLTSTNLNLTGIINPGQVHVICNSAAGAGFLAQADQVNGGLSFNGDDAIALYNGANEIDIFGRIGEDPGASWVSGSHQTVDRTLVRNSNVINGVAINPGSGFPTLSTEWAVFPIDNNANLGTHTMLTSGNVATLTVTDVSGNSASCNAAVTVIDNTPPVANCQPLTIQLDAFGNASISASQLNNGSTDACGGLTFSASQTSFDCSDVGSNSVVLTVTDVNGNSSTCTTTVTVQDVTSPTISCPANISVNNDPAVCGAVINYIVPIGVDACGTSTIQIAGLPSGATFPVGTTVNTFQMTDGGGNIATCSFTVQVTDNEDPTILNCPANFSSCNPVTWTPPTISDNCPGVVINASHVPGSVFPSGTTTVTYTATDAYNNVSTCSFDVTRYEESVAATSITSDRDFNNICIGESINLTINGGTLGQGGVWKWHTGSCAGTALPAFDGMTTINVSPAVTTTYFANAEGLCNTTTCVSITVVVSNSVPPNGILAITSMPPYGAPGVTGTITCTPVPGATFYRWTSINGHINAIWFPSTPGPVETSVPSVNVLFNLPLSNYQIRVTAGNACGRTTNASGHIRGTVPASTCLAGPALACPLTTATYSVAACPIPNTNSYQWAVTGNATITAGQGTPTITVAFGAGFTNGTVCVNGITNFGLAGPQTCLNVSNSTSAPGAISGNDEPCESAFENYTIAPVAGASSYLWTTNIVGASANGTTTSGSVQFPSGPFSGLVCVQAISSCGMSVASCYNVTSGVAGIPGPILGPESGICGAIGNYALTTSDANTYNWILPAGVSFASANGSNSVQLQFPSTPGVHVITVEAFYDCGSATSTINVDGAPGTPIVTPATICAGGTDETYIASAAGADSYNWTTSGAVYEQCSNPSCSNYYIIWDTPGGSFQVEAENLCGVSAVPFSLSTNCRISEGQRMETKVYPNPTTGQLTVEFTSYAGGTYNMTVSDMSGRIVLTEDVKYSSGNNEYKLNLESANPGMYMLYIKDGNGQISVTKITVE